MKKSKKIVSLLVLVTLMMTLLAGCNATELSYWDQSYKQYMTAMTTNVYATAEMSVKTPSVDMLTAFMPAKEQATMKPFLNYIKDGKFKMEVAQNVKNDQQMMKVYGKSTSDQSFKLIYEMVRINKKTYMKIEPLQSFITTLLPNTDVTNEDVMKALSKTDYLVITDEELKTSFAGSENVNALGSNMKMSSNEQLQVMEPFIKMFDEIIKKGYDGYSMNITKQEGNKYTMTLEFKSIGKLAVDFLNYSIDNSNKIQDVAFQSAKAIPASSYATLAGLKTMTDLEKTVAIDSAQAQVKEMLKDPESIKTLFATQIEQAQAELVKMVGDSKMTYTSDFVDANHVNQEFAMNLALKLPEQAMNLTMNLDGKSATEYNAAYVIQEPVGKVMTLTQLMAVLPKVYKVDPYEGLAYYSEGLTSKEAKLDIVQSKGANYIAMASTNLFTDGPAKIDLKKKTAVIKKGKQTITVPVEIINKKPYMKVSELKKLGYSITWNEDLELIIIKAAI